MHTIERFVVMTISTIVLFATLSSPIMAEETISEYTGSEEVGYTEEDLQQLECLATNIYHEAGAESYEGKLAVAQVTMNRVNSGKFPDTICGVVKQKTKVETGKTVCQFSWVCERKAPPRKLTLMWEECYNIAKSVFFDDLRLDKLSDRVMYFHNNHASPGWGLRRIARIGGHIFYSDEKAVQKR